MSLTAAEQAELDAINAELASMDDEQAGETALKAMNAARKPRPKPRPFSLFRATVGSVRDAFQGLVDAGDDIADELQRRVPTPGVVFGAQAQNGIIGFLSPEETTKLTSSTRSIPSLPTLKGEENAGTAERVTRGIGSFLVPFIGWSKALGVARAQSTLGRIGLASTAGVVTDFTQQDPVAGNLANTLKDTFGLSNSALNALAYEEDDSALEARFKAAASGAIFGVAADAATELGLRTLKAYRAWRGSVEEADAAVKAAQAPMKVDWKPIPKAEPRSAEETAGAAPAATKSIDPEMAVTAERPPENFEDILTFLQRKAAAGASDEEVSRIADTLMSGNLESGLTKMGIDPVKLDWSQFDDPAMLGRFHDSLRDIYEVVGQRLGRSNVRVSEKMIHSAARSMATTADVLKDLFGNTQGLAETLMASRLFVGSHASKLLAQADAALKALKAGDGQAEWAAFLESFHRHAYFLGALRGAGSEVARALRSLQMVAKVGKKTASAVAETAVREEAGKQLSNPRQIAMEASDAVSQMTEPAEQLLLLSKIIEKGGDVGDLSRFVRAKSGSTLRRLDAALGETRGNLFSSGTAIMNAASASAMMGMRSLALALAGVVRMTLSPLGKNHSMAARLNFMQAWAYTDGMLSGWRAAFTNTLKLFEREGFGELAVNLDGLGMKALAKKAASASAEASAGVRGNFERVDIEAGDRAFAMTAADRRYLNGLIEQWDTPALMEHSLKFVTRGVGAAINAAGTMSRLGTILFINAPDQFMGTLAAKAGAQARAVRLAAQEAAELQLEGKALTDYLRARTVQLTETVNGGFADDAYDAGQREAALAHGDAEAREVLFQDDLELGFTRGVSRALGSVPFFHYIVPFIKTPLRILERTAIDFTPLGLAKDRVRRAIMAGGPERDEALARLGLGMMMTATAFQLAEDRQVIGQDGDYKSSARLSRPSYSLKIGDDVYEFSRIDPLGTLMGWGADVRSYLDRQEDNPDASGEFMQMFEAAVWATQANVLSKTWLTSLKNLSELADASGDKEFSTRMAKYLESFGARIMPASGVQRSVEKGINGFVPQTAGFMDSLMAAGIGADKMPPKRDPLLGRPVPVESGERLFGLKAGPSNADDPLLTELENLSYDIPRPSRTVLGVKLTAAQFSRWLELKGQVAINPKTGLTLEESLQALIDLPEYQALPRAGRIEAIREETKGFSRLATDALLQEDKEFAQEAVRKETWATMTLQGASRGEIDAETERFARELGLIE